MRYKPVVGMMALIVFSVIALNVHGRAVWVVKSPHGRGWMLGALNGRLQDNLGNVITRSTHPHVFAERPMVAHYSHGWPCDICWRSAYTDPRSNLIYEPDFFAQSSSWPIDSAPIYWFGLKPLLWDVGFGLGLILIGCWLVIAILQPYRPPSTDTHVS